MDEQEEHYDPQPIEDVEIDPKEHKMLTLMTSVSRLRHENRQLDEQIKECQQYRESAEDDRDREVVRGQRLAVDYNKLLEHYNAVIDERDVLSVEKCQAENENNTLVEKHKKQNKRLAKAYVKTALTLFFLLLVFALMVAMTLYTRKTDNVVPVDQLRSIMQEFRSETIEQHEVLEQRKAEIEPCLLEILQPDQQFTGDQF